MSKEIKINLVLNDKQIDGKILNADKLVNQLRVSATKTSDVFLKWSVITTGFNQALSLGRQVFSVAQQMVQPFMKFETGMANVNSILKLSQVEFEKMSADTMGLQKDLGLTSEELTGGLYDLVSAGVQAKDALKILEIAARSSIAGLTDTKVAADGLTTVINSFKYASEDAEKVADIMFKTVELGKTTFEELAGSLSEVAPIAAASGISFEEISGAIATLTKQGVPTSAAVTQIRASIVSLNEIMKDGWAKTMTYQEAVQLLNEKSGGSPKVLKEMMGRVEGVNAVLALTGKSLEMAASDLDLVTNSTGAMGSAFEINSDTMARKIAKIEEGFNTLLIKSVGAMEPMLTGALEAGERMINNIDKIGTAFDKLSETEGFKTFKFFMELSPGTLPFKVGEGSQILPEQMDLTNQKFEEQFDLFDLGIIKWGTFTDVAKTGLGEVAKSLKEGSKELESFLNKPKEIVGGNKEDMFGGKVSDDKKKGKETFTPGFFDVDLMEEEQELIEEFILRQEELAQQEMERVIDLNNLKTEIFEEEKLMQEEQQFLDEMIYYSREELLTKEIELEQQRFNIMKQLSSAENLAEVEDLKKQKSIVDKRIQNIRAEVQAREEQTKQMILAGSQQYDASVSLGKQMNQMANEAIRRIIAEAVATQIAKVIAMIPWPFNLIAAPLAGLTVQAMIEKFIPKFATGGMINGKRHSSGGVMVNAEGGEYIVNRQSTRGNIELLEAINSARGSVALNGGSSIEVVRAINSLGNDIRQLQVIAKINPREFDEDFADYSLKKSHTG